jgi:hypothetical protein
MERPEVAATAMPRPTMRAPLEAAAKEATQTQRTETQYRVWVSSPLEIALVIIFPVTILPSTLKGRVSKSHVIYLEWFY